MISQLLFLSFLPENHQPQHLQKCKTFTQCFCACTALQPCSRTFYSVLEYWLPVVSSGDRKNQKPRTHTAAVICHESRKRPILNYTGTHSCFVKLYSTVVHLIPTSQWGSVCILDTGCSPLASVLRSLSTKNKQRHYLFSR